MITLGIDTSNYATSVALVDNDSHQVIFSEKRFLPVEEGKIGLRQQQALFEHIKNLTNIFSSYKGMDIGAVGVSVRPKDEENSYALISAIECDSHINVSSKTDKEIFFADISSGEIFTPNR